MCIARDEDEYIEEWIDYHLFIGFDKIFIYGHCWDYKIPTKYKDCVTFIKLDTEKYVQYETYNKFKNEHLEDFEWVMYLDVDEFLNIREKKYNHNVKKLLSDFDGYDFLSLNWKNFGSYGMKKIKKNNRYSSILRFTHCKSYLDRDTRTIYNFSKIRYNKNAQKNFITSHIYNRDDIDLNGFDFTNHIEEELNIAYINHYHVRSKEEYIKKHTRNLKVANKVVDKVSVMSFEKSFIERNIGCNEDEDSSLRNFWLKKVIK